MRPFGLLLLTVLLLVGCSRPAPPAPNTSEPITPAPLTPAASGLQAKLRLSEAVPGGDLWLDLDQIPEGALLEWRVGITDGDGTDFLFGWLTRAPERVYHLPSWMAPGTGFVWITAGEESPGPGTVRLPVTLMPKYDTYDSEALGVGFTVPTGWRLYEAGGTIRLERTWERGPIPVEEIIITRCPERSCLPTDGTVDEGEHAVGSKRVPQFTIQRTTENQATFWTEQHVILREIDVILRHREPVQGIVYDVYHNLLQSVYFLGDPPPIDPVVLCTPVLAGVHPAIDLDWTPAQGGPCWMGWEQEATGLHLYLSWAPADSESWVYDPRPIPIEGGRYTGQIGYQILEKTGAAFWGPHAWSLEVTGERGRVTLTCGMRMAPDRETAQARQELVDGVCSELLGLTAVGDLGQAAP